MNNYTIREDSLHYKKPIYKKFKNFKDCEKWIKNNLDNTKNYKVFNGLYYTTIYNSFTYIMEQLEDNDFNINPDLYENYLIELMEDYNNE